MKASNLAVKAVMRARRSSKLKSMWGSWVRGEFAYGERGIGALWWEVRKEGVEVEKWL